MKDPLKKYIQDHREEFDTLEVSGEMFDKIMLKVENTTSSVTETRSLFSWKNFAVAASIILIFSLGIFNLLQEKEISKSIYVTKQISKKDDRDGNDILIHQKESEIAGIDSKKIQAKTIVLANSNFDDVQRSKKNQSSAPSRSVEDKVHLYKANAVELLDNQFSASSRLQGIDLLKDLPDYDANIIELLSEKAISDENTNVRLAAVSALEIQRSNPVITSKIQQIFIKQNDPMVQKELISFFAAQQLSELSDEVNTKLLALAQDPATVAFVKDEAYAVLMKY
ncbi:MAG: HEAT repeat domain-containing protein [Chryseobacterium sp.]|nr:MAG: HEAT repeat domain-containing protein [Chryseobacterium sp.]